MALAACLAAASEPAESRAEVRKQVEASMLVTGRIEIDTAGKVIGYALDKQDRLPRGVVDMVGKAVPAWKFEPVVIDGKLVRAAASMSIRLVARKLDDDHLTVDIRSASFGSEGGKAEEMIRPAKRLIAPGYPAAAVRSGVTGAAYLLVKVGRDGKVIDVATEQVNLKVVATGDQMARWRDLLAAASMSQARKWSFAPPTEGPAAGAEFWVVRVPVVYAFDRTAYGTWEGYVPGPRQPNPWQNEDKEGVAFSPDTLPPGGAYLAGTGLKLLTAPSGG
ncbi:protein tonB [Lysobacter terrestris]|uniref:Protein tonB n=1 Tax=Agrilutibacter terrestris TaxID=2865112 RepID=A0A7H0G1J1_9GAMM|nr:protein tonB [Lysobacter terrestris]